MSEFKLYRKNSVQPMRPYEKGESMDGVSVTEGVIAEVGGMIAKSATDPTDQWYISKEFFEANYSPADGD